MIKNILQNPMKFDFAKREDAIESIYNSISLIVDCYSRDSILDNYLDQETIDKLRFILNDIEEGVIK